METIITFEIAGEQYTMFVEGILKKKYYLSKDNKGSVLSDPIPVKVTASTMKESIMYWLECLQIYMRKAYRRSMVLRPKNRQRRM